MAISDHYTMDVTVNRPTVSVGSSGAPMETFASHLSFKGLIRPLTGRELFASGKQTSFSTHRLYCDVADIDVKDQIVANGNTFQVRYVENPNNLNHHLEVDMELIE